MMIARPRGARWTLTLRLFAALLTAAVLTTAAALGLAYVGARDAFSDHVAAVERERLAPIARQAEALYQRDGDWRAAQAWTERGGSLARLLGPQRFGPPPPVDAPPPPPFDRLGLFDATGRALAGRADAADGPRRALIVAGQEVGSLRLAPETGPWPELEERFNQDQSRRFAAAGLVALLIGAGTAWGVARHVRRPVTALVAGARALTAGAYDARLSEDRSDELGDLARAFNRLAETLARQDEGRRRWVSDTSHELRTPIALMLAQIEAMQDGVRPADAVNLAFLRREAARLGQLAEDLADLAQSDRGSLAYSFDSLDPVALAEEAAARYAPLFAAADLTLTLGPRPTTPTLALGDPTRLADAIDGLMENALRYTDAGGGLTLSFQADRRWATLQFDDTPPGVDDADLPRLFDRFFRVEASRSRAHGGAGLGLALCRGVVEAHGGRLTAAPSPLGGLRLTLALPLVASAAAARDRSL